MSACIAPHLGERDADRHGAGVEALHVCGVVANLELHLAGNLRGHHRHLRQAARAPQASEITPLCRPEALYAARTLKWRARHGCQSRWLPGGCHPSRAQVRPRAQPSSACARRGRAIRGQAPCSADRRDAAEHGVEISVCTRGARQESHRYIDKYKHLERT